MNGQVNNLPSNVTDFIRNAMETITRQNESIVHFMTASSHLDRRLTSLENYMALHQRNSISLQNITSLFTNMFKSKQNASITAFSETFNNNMQNISLEVQKLKSRLELPDCMSSVFQQNVSADVENVTQELRKTNGILKDLDGKVKICQESMSVLSKQVTALTAATEDIQNVTEKVHNLTLKIVHLDRMSFLL